MSFKKFGANDLVLNTMKAHPHNEFLIYNGALYYNSVPDQSGSRHTYVRNVPPGFVSLYEYNIDRPSGNNIYPFVIKSGRKDSSGAFQSGCNLSDGQADEILNFLKVKDLSEIKNIIKDDRSIEGINDLERILRAVKGRRKNKKC